MAVAVGWSRQATKRWLCRRTSVVVPSPRYGYALHVGVDEAHHIGRGPYWHGPQPHSAVRRVVNRSAVGTTVCDRETPRLQSLQDVSTNVVETVCEDCSLGIDEQRIDHGRSGGAYDDEECDRTGAPLAAARQDRGLSTEIGRGTDAKGNELSDE